MITLNPSFCLGEVIVKGDSTSVEIVPDTVNNKKPWFKIRLPLVDLKDVVKAHLEAALSKEDLNGKRVIISNAEPFEYHKMGQWVADFYNEKSQSNAISIKEVEIPEQYQRMIKYNNEESTKLFGIKYDQRSMKDAMWACVKSFWDRELSGLKGPKEEEKKAEDVKEQPAAQN